MTLNEWLAEWLNVYKIPYLKESSIKRIKVSIKNHIPQWLKDKELDKLTAFDIDKALASVPHSRSRKYSYFIITNSLHRAYCLDLISSDLSRKVNLIKHKQKRGNALTHEEQEYFLHRIENIRADVANAFKFLLYTGVRRGELLSLRYSDVLYQDGLIFIRGTKTETSERYIILSKEARGILAAQKKYSKNDVVFPFNADLLTHTFKQILPNHKLHDLRHTFITRCAESGININVCQNLVGHKSLNTTLGIYTHISIDFTKSEFNKFKV